MLNPQGHRCVPVVALHYVFIVTSVLCLPPEPAAFSVKTTLRTRNRKVTNPHSAPMSLTLQVISNAPVFVCFSSTPPPLFCFRYNGFNWGGGEVKFAKAFHEWRSSPRLNQGQEAAILLQHRPWLSSRLPPCPYLSLHAALPAEVGASLIPPPPPPPTAPLSQHLIRVFVSSLPFRHRQQNN